VPTPQPKRILRSSGRFPAPTGCLSAPALGDFSITAADLSTLLREDLLGALVWQGRSVSPASRRRHCWHPAVADAAVPLELEPSGSPSRRRPFARERRMGPSTSRL